VAPCSPSYPSVRASNSSPTRTYDDDDDGDDDGDDDDDDDDDDHDDDDDALVVSGDGADDRDYSVERPVQPEQ